MVDPEPDPDRDTDTDGQDQDPHQSTSTDSPQDAPEGPIVISVDPTTIADPTKRHGDPDGPDDDADDPDQTPLSIGDRNPYPDQVDGTGPIQPMAQPDDDPDPNPNAIPTIADDWASATDPDPDDDTDNAPPVVVRAGISANAAMTAAGTIERSLQEDIDAVLFPLFVAGDDISLARDALTDALDHELTDAPSPIPVIRYAEAPIHLEWWLSDREATAFIDGLDHLEDMDTDHDAFLMEFLIGPGVADDVATDLMDAVRQLRRQSGVDTPSAGGS